ncbi:MAG: Asp-tRNA(Asn)/Glu-tRNA(Gln) amidotransferase subunit GatA [Holosporales bacterium]|jgi:aspartyl-tRNA(Asn)/glutamyl-tRNA(Gln) amidotransferase subunit A|nr:Asp-tRNA(Asn)/Glu-tRNA(Gln) amidotransferase subunit GatA [Holosporales bacterium]
MSIGVNMISNLTIRKTVEGLRSKEFSALELVNHYLERIDKNKDLNAFITLNEEGAIKAAKEADEKISSNTEAWAKERMLGVPIGVKDLFCTKGIRTTAGSRILEDFVPQYESTVSQNLLNNGAIFLGKTNMDEFAMGSSNLTSYFGPSWLRIRKKTNPNTPLVPGGSSGGSAAAVSADLVVAATGSDTGGSVRQPAAFAGIVGIKPTYGLCSRYGMVAFASSLDQAGPMTKTVEDAAIMLNSMAGYDPKDSTSEKVDIPEYLPFIGQSVKGLRIGIAKQYTDGLNEDNLRVLDCAKQWLQDAGCQIVDISLETTPYALPAYYIIAPAEASSNLARYDGVRYGHRAENPANIDDMYTLSRSEGFGEEVKRRILAGTYILSAGHYDAYYNRALKIRKMIKNDFRDNAFSKADLVLTATTPMIAFGIDDEAVNDPVQMYLNDVFTVTVNIAGLPAISVPGGVSAVDELPLGVQLIGNYFDEQTIFKAASVIEKSYG